MIYVTGDVHGSLGITKFSFKNFPQGRHLTKNDYLIICGDFGLVFFGDKEEDYWLKWLNNKPWTTIVVGGNHENYTLIENNYPIETWKGAKVRRIRDSIIWVERGEILDLDGTTFFCFGGAASVDKEYREEEKTWWSRELPAPHEYENALFNLTDRNFCVDYCITHEVPSFISKMFFYKCYEFSNFLDSLDKKIECNRWYHGHLHMNKPINRLHTILYQNIVRIK